MVNAIDFKKRIYCIITGASRGIGRGIAIELARKSTNSLSLVLLARSESDLEETKTLIKNRNENANVTNISINLATATRAQFEKILNDTYDKAKYDFALIFHNAGQMGLIKKTVDLHDVELWKEYYSLDFFSVTLLNSVFIRKVKDDTNKITVVNITGLVGREPFKYLCMCGSAKAARDMYFKVLAKEEPEIDVLNYGPGMVNTDMTNEFLLIMNNFKDAEIQSGGSAIITPEQTACKMFSLLEKAEYASGDFINYSD